MKPILTIGMAVLNDFENLWNTVQNLKIQIAANRLQKEVEIVVIDAEPDSVAGDRTKKLIESWGGSIRTRYFTIEKEKFGTSQSRNKVFEVAEGEWVMCIDSHILLFPTALPKFVDWLIFNVNSDHLYSGPIHYDHLTGYETHFNMEWGAEMWGRWGCAWYSPQRELFTVVSNSQDRTLYCDLSPEMNPIDIGIKTTSYSGHDKFLLENGCTRAADTDAQLPFEIPAMGLGLFACRRESWLGFNPEFRGFGGEEGYIHEKYRQAGRTSYCLPFLRWNHQFADPRAVKYTVDTRNKLRNYLIGFNELGLDIRPVYEHFVRYGRVSMGDWLEMVKDPVAFKPIYSQPLAVTHGQLVQEQQQVRIPNMPPLPDINNCSIEELYQWVRRIPRDLNEHSEQLKVVAYNSRHVTEFTKRRESTLYFLAGRPEYLISYNAEGTDPMMTVIKNTVVRDTGEEGHISFTINTGNVDSLLVDIDETDALFLDTEANYARLSEELKKHSSKVRKFIVIHDTMINGELGDDGKLGLNYALREFVKENPQWKVYSFSPAQYGLTVLTCDPAMYPAEEIKAWPPQDGKPGFELMRIMESLGIKPREGCSCRKTASQMDFDGIDKCREKRDYYLAEIEANSEKYKWTDYIKAGYKALLTGIYKDIDPRNMFGSLFDLAVQKAEEHQLEAERLRNESLSA